MRSARYERMTKILADPDVMLRVAERIGRFELGTRDTRPGDASESFAPRQRAALQAHASYFRERYFESGSSVAGIEPLLQHAVFIEASKHLYGRTHVRPVSVWANLLLPGQKIALHTDVPEFRGMRRGKEPDWLLVAMHHSGLFDDWRISAATIVICFGSEPAGGAFVFYPDGPYGRSVAAPAEPNTGILFDAESVYHGVDSLARKNTSLPELTPRVALRYGGDGAWVLDDDHSEMARYRWEDVRYAVAWKAHCFADAAEETKVREHTRDISRQRVLEVLRDDLNSRGRGGDAPRDETQLAQRIFENYVKFPPARPSTAAGR